VIALIDYGMGNRRSVEKALEHVGAASRLTADHDVLRSADGVILPGVGAFPEAMRRLARGGLDELIAERAGGGTPVLGICLGMQLLFESSAELGGAAGLGLLAGAVTALDPRGAKLPHIGWNQVGWRRPSPLTAGLPDPCAFYHVHSFVVRPADESDVIGESRYGEPFASVVGRDPVYGAQFHPEKSSAAGLRLLSNFAAICARVAA
jgi:imidazole glycerol-phosphate synthase subunit HisH